MYERRPTFFRVDDAPTGRRVDATVKWFNAVKGFGFVTLPDGGDALLPMAALRRAGFEDVREGAALSCEVGSGARGLIVVRVLAVGNAAAARGRVASAAPHSRRIEGTVKWFDAAKGYGFVASDSGDKDVFVHVSAVRRSGIGALVPGQRVRLELVEGRRGPEAAGVALL